MPRDFIEYENFINQPESRKTKTTFMHFSEIPGDGMLYVNDSFKIKETERKEKNKRKK